MDAARKVAELGERLLRILVCLLDERAGGFRIGVELGAGAPEVDREGREALLGAVVQIALDAPALGDGGIDGFGALPGELLLPLVGTGTEEPADGSGVRRSEGAHEPGQRDDDDDPERAGSESHRQVVGSVVASPSRFRRRASTRVAPPRARARTPRR